MVTFPTYRHSRDVAPKSTLDLVITNKPDRLMELTEGDSLGHTAIGQTHCLLIGIITVSAISTASMQKKPRFIWSRADFAAFSQFIGAYDWMTLFLDRSVNECYAKLAEIYDEAVKRFIPKTTEPFRKKSEVWVTPEVRAAVKLKQQLWLRYLAAGRHTHRELKRAHKEACKNVVRVVKLAMLSFEEDLVHTSMSDPMRLHAYIRSKQQNHELIRAIETADGSTTTDQDVICRTLNEYFQSVFAVEPDDPLPVFQRRIESVCAVNENIFTVEKVMLRLSELMVTKAKGVDGFHPRILNKCAAVLAIPITQIFRLSVAAGIVPDLWKQANVTPIFKKGSKLKASNYRPVSLTSVLCKICEKFIHEQIMCFCTTNNLITKAQHGFVRKKDVSQTYWKPAMFLQKVFISVLQRT